jgi:selenocysteine-specific elongation factor
MPYIIGTAGHIDHGKTSLVKALTGQDTDRLKEEKERGISIDLGFAHLDLPDGSRAGVVDVPGHERFIRNMLAGAHGIDLVLFTVAADDGVMPQTEEHLDIVHLLGVQRAIFVITKADLASDARLREVAEEIQILTEGTSLEGAPIVPFSSVTGQGLEELRTQIARTFENYRKNPPPGYFRLPVDRVFVLQGHGLIVTGTALSGEVKAGDRVRCLPGDQTFRVRSLQVHDQPVATATWGQRVAMNLSGHEKASIERGDVICHEQLTMTSQRFDALLEVRPTAKKGIKNHQRVRVHVGTAERLAKLILLGGQEKAAPKQSVYAQVVLSAPVLALRGDHFVVRDETAQGTLGGGIVLHPFARRHSRSDPDLQRKLEAFHRGALVDVVEAFIDESKDFALPIAAIHQFLNLQEEQVRELLRALKPIRAFALEGETLYSTESRWSRVKQELLESLRRFHAAHPLAPGIDMDEARDDVSYAIGPRLFRACVDQLAADGAVARDANLLRLPEYKVRLRDDEQDLVDRITALLSATPLAPPDLKQLEQDLGIGRAKLGEIIRVMERLQRVVRVGPELYFLRTPLEQLRTALSRHLLRTNEITPGAFRDLFGTSRKYTIPLLEYFDREGVTVRVGDVRKLRQAPGESRPASETTSWKNAPGERR